MEEDVGSGEGLMRQMDGYCERVDFTYWSEPVNALTNVAFLIAAIWMWRRIATHGAGETEGVTRLLCVTVAIIAIGSYLWHTHATAWSVIIDVLGIALFILVYCYAANRYLWGWSAWVSVLAAVAFIPYAAVVGGAFGQLPFFEISAAYWPVAVLILIYGGALWNRRREAAQGMLIGAGILGVSLTFRSVDELVCEAVPLGTHFLWHVLNGIMLGWMIEVVRREGRRPATPALG